MRADYPSEFKKEVKMSDKKCDDCRRRKPDVAWRICPWHQEITGEKLDALLCDQCYHERAMDV